jgi:hypothetical protein
MDDLSKYKSFMEKSIKEADERREIINHLNEYREFSEQNIQQFWGYFLIVDSPWQISKVIIDNRQEIKNGYIKLSNYHCSVHDVVKKEYFALFHERINNVTRHDKVLRVSYSDGHTMDLYPRVLGANINSIVLGGLGFLLNLATEDSTSDYQKSVQDREARDRSQARTSEAEWKEAYIQGWFNFLRNILKEKNER